MDLAVLRRSVHIDSHGRPLDPDQPFMLFIHGAGMDHTVWNLQARYFAYHGVNALALDLPGHGRSEGLALPTIEAMAAWLIDLLDAAGAARARLVGHSMGALVALHAAAAHPRRIAGLALLGTAPAMPVHQALLEAAARDQPLAGDLVSSWGLGPAGHRGGSTSPGGWLMGQSRALLARAPAGVLRLDLAACDAYKGGPAAAARIGAQAGDETPWPILIVAGGLDRMTPPRQAAKLAAALPGAVMLTLAGSGHMMMVEQPGQTLDALIRAFS